MKPFRFCPSCATELAPPDEDGALRCPACGRVWYRNMAPTVGAGIVSGGRALVTVRARAPEKGRLDVPGGFLHIEEHPVDGLKREVKEELGVEIDVSVRDCLQMEPHPYGADGDMLLSLGFKARLVEGTPHPSDDVADIIWVTEDDVGELDFAWEHDRRLVRTVLERG